jgi:hypothetical protein
VRHNIAIALLAGVLLACAPQYQSHQCGPVRDHVTFVDDLRCLKLRVEPVEQVTLPAFSVPATRLNVSGGTLREPVELLSFWYDDTDLRRDARQVAEDDARRISSDGTRATLPNGTVLLAYDGPPHLFRRERVIVIYAGSDPEMISTLRDLLGTQFAGN